MNSFKDLFPENLYHSYIVEGDPESTIINLQEFLKSRDDIGDHSPDFICQSYESFAIADASYIKEWHSKKAITSEKRICIIGAKFINAEAEQSLLKIIEEPQVNTHFFLVVPNASILLDTILSRTHTVKVANGEESIFKKRAETFIKETPASRIELVAKLIDENKNNETSGGLRFQAIELINEIEKSFYKKFKADKNNKDMQFILDELQNSRMYLSTPGASVKIILEHIALVL